MATNFHSLPGEMDLFSNAIKELNGIELRFRRWYRFKCPEDRKEAYKGLYESFATHISEGRADLGALFSEYLVNSAAVLAEKEEEEQS